MTAQEVIKNSRLAFLYGFRSGGYWLYIGSTLNPERRQAKLRVKYRQLKRAEFQILRSADTAEIGRIEKQVIANLKKRGQAIFNIAVSGSRGLADEIGYGDIVWLETGMRFSGIQAAARGFNVPPWTLKTQIKQAAGKPFRLSRHFEFSKPIDGKWGECQLVPNVTLQKP